MEKQIIIRDDHELQAQDYMDIQSYTEARDDHTVYDGIHSGYKYTGFQVTKSAAAEITATSGRLYKEGRTYARDESTVHNLFSHLPLVTSKIVALVAWGTTEDTRVEPRDYLIDPDTNTTEPRSVAMERRRYGNLSIVAGVESASPQKPTTDSSVLVIAWVTLDATGVVSIEQATENILPSVMALDALMAEFAAWRAQIGARLNTIASDIAALSTNTSTSAASVDLSNVMADVARLKEVADLPDSYSDYGADRFLTDDESDTDNINYSAAIEEGLRFPRDAEDETAIQVFNPLNPNVVISNNFLLPKYTEVTRLEVGPPDGSKLSIAQYQYQTFNYIRRLIARGRWRWGSWYISWSPGAIVWWRTLDAVHYTFKRAGDVWAPRPVVVPWPYPWYYPVRYRGYWLDRARMMAYWSELTSSGSFSGSQIAQTFLNSQDGWLTSLSFLFPTTDTSGNIEVTVCEADAAGRPDLTKVLSTTTLPYASIVKSTKVYTKVAIPATFLESGKRYAVCLTTAANHYVATATKFKYAQGTLFYSTDGAFFQGDLTKDLVMSLHFAEFDQSRVEVELQSLSLSGGITDIDINAGTVIPAATDLIFEVQTADGNWHTMASITDTTPLAGLPPLLHFRAVFLGTKDVMPGLNLGDAYVNVSRPKTSFRHVSEERTIASPSSSIDVILKLHNYTEAIHNCTVQINPNGAGLEAADTVSDTVRPDGIIERKFHFALAGGAVSDYVIDIQGTTTTALDTFAVLERVDIAN